MKANKTPMKSEVVGCLQKLKDGLAENIYGKEVKEDRKKGLCIQCRESALEKCYSEAGRREYCISGLCEGCWDNMMKGLEES